MPRNPRYDTLFEPMKTGPVIAQHRFCQAPHCNGLLPLTSRKDLAHG